MTNNEILQASLLDILFDKRNKDYGAYILRRQYNHRLLTALGGALSVMLVILLLASFNTKNVAPQKPVFENHEVIIQSVELPKDEPKEPKRQKQVSKPIEKTAQDKFTSNIKIQPDKVLAKTEMPAITDLTGKEISTVTVLGKPPDGIEKLNTTIEKNSGQSNSETLIDPFEREPEFPGGHDALVQFLRNNLNTPDELEAGEKKMIQVRFKVGTDGQVADMEIVKSGGNIFDIEVVRVCKKMPRWKPAVQNGTNVAVSYILPITFIGAEQ
ncbi:MAG TPA: energy transducer TonB [Chitinophagaceae bacterium]|nr:energy transducer TonB [Chitinophagaceae bacterium]